jgi:hypothetical protein
MDNDIMMLFAVGIGFRVCGAQKLAAYIYKFTVFHSAMQEIGLDDA